MNLYEVTSSLDRDGFFLLPGAFTSSDCERYLREWAKACEGNGHGVMRSESGAVYGARNVFDI